MSSKVNLDQCVVELVKRINYSFAVDKDDSVLAGSIFSGVLRVLHTVYLRHPTELKERLTGFNCFFDLEQWLRLDDSEAEKTEELSKYYACKAANRFFKNGWTDVCDQIVDKDLKRCLKKGLVCFKAIYSFFRDCGKFYALKKDQGSHLQFCKDLKTHPEDVMIEFKSAVIAVRLLTRLNPRRSCSFKDCNACKIVRSVQIEWILENFKINDNSK